MTYRSVALAFGTLLVWSGATGSAEAQSQNDVYAISCQSCLTTQDFSTAARIESFGNAVPGTFMVVSQQSPRMAIIQVTGHWNFNGDATWVLDSSTPMDFYFNSLAGESEAALESFYTTLDEANIGTSRDNPMWLTSTQNASLPGSFIGTTDAQITAYLNSSFPNNTFQKGDTLTIIFKDQSSAEFMVTNSKPPYTWQWTGVAHDKDGNPLNRDGSVRKPPPGLIPTSTDSSLSTPVGPDFTLFQDTSYCYSTTHISLDGWTSPAFISWFPC